MQQSSRFRRPRIYPYRSTAASADCRIAEGLFDDVVDECEQVGWYGETESQSWGWSPARIWSAARPAARRAWHLENHVGIGSKASFRSRPAMSGCQPNNDLDSDLPAGR